ncbi:hypothetical protein FF098_008200 [Parvularcula flava]|uniref:Uncharacterized protein n=1 Tax=Aquisalinus luteolus TaxID=1566827 RepID=A0A8J3A1V3_9PROT|nr:hypothetical protein [Aquisalinus luteolus]NHK27880.1 hypothetical protein [Aquisalinus luteolus]GGH96786.1 hypothetical protein GCM10011355_16510 [Aquisalinus luteolus]
MLKNLVAGTAIAAALWALPVMAQETGCAGISEDGVGIPKQDMVLTWEDDDGDTFDETVMVVQEGFVVTLADYEDFQTYLVFYKHEFLTEFAADRLGVEDVIFSVEEDGTRKLPAAIIIDLRTRFTDDIAALDQLWPLEAGKTAAMIPDAAGDYVRWTVGEASEQPFPDADGKTTIMPLLGASESPGIEPGRWTLNYSTEHCMVVELWESFGHDAYHERVTGISLP